MPCITCYFLYACWSFLFSPLALYFFHLRLATALLTSAEYACVGDVNGGDSTTSRYLTGKVSVYATSP